MAEAGAYLIALPNRWDRALDRLWSYVEDRAGEPIE